MVVCEIVDSAEFSHCRHGGDAPDILNMDAVEDLVRLDDALGGAGAQFVEGRAARSVNAGKPQDQQRQSAFACKVEPELFRVDAIAPARIDCPGRGAFVDPVAAGIAINAYCRKIAEPLQIRRRIQIGFDPETGEELYEDRQLDFQVLPQIVLIVDELADLMVTVGKEIEVLIQRLSQKSRAAGIHLIMATQRPSVDVITGVIKANLPTRISFQVTSKIDSRTILGEQGAEQLLGKGDMLYMPGGKQIVRVHGPFVSDEEVRHVAEHWRRQGVPEYIQAVTEEPEDGGYLFDGQPVGEEDAETQLYRKAVQIVAESQKASTSDLQRQLRVGYNSAARLIERMEKDGLVGQPDHVGRREVLIDTDGHPL